MKGMTPPLGAVRTLGILPPAFPEGARHPCFSYS